MIDVEKTGNRRCWHTVVVASGTVLHKGVTANDAKKLARMYSGSRVGYCRDGHKLIPCDGAAHSNPHIDNCGRCAPRWGWVMVPA